MTSKSRPMVKCTCAGPTVRNQFVVYSIMISVLRVGSIPVSIIGSLRNPSPTILPVLLPHPRTQICCLLLFCPAWRSYWSYRCHVVGSIMKDIREVCGAPTCIFIFIWGLPCLIFERRRPKKRSKIAKL